MTDARLILQLTGLRYWQNKTLDQMTDEDCEECLRYIQTQTGTYYYLRGR